MSAWQVTQDSNTEQAQNATDCGNKVIAAAFRAQKSSETWNDVVITSPDGATFTLTRTTTAP